MNSSLLDEQTTSPVAYDGKLNLLPKLYHEIKINLVIGWLVAQRARA
jgi:hypothetical protein